MDNYVKIIDRGEQRIQRRVETSMKRQKALRSTPADIEGATKYAAAGWRLKAIEICEKILDDMLLDMPERPKLVRAIELLENKKLSAAAEKLMQVDAHNTVTEGERR